MVLGANYQGLAGNIKSSKAKFIGGYTMGLRGVIFPQGVFTITANMEVLMGVELFNRD